MRNFIQRFARDESGATAIEYALIAALIAVVIAGGAGILGGAIDGMFRGIGSSLPDAPTAG